MQILNQEDQAQIRWEIQRTKVRPVVESINSLFNEDLTESCRQMRIPTLILDGEKAVRVPVGVSKHLQSLIPNSQLVILPGVGYDLIMGKPKEFVKIVLDFLK